MSKTVPDYDIAGSQLEGLAKTEERLEKDAYNLQKKEDESIEVSYSILSVEQQRGTNDEILQKIATTINVQLTVEGSEGLPFVSFANLDNAKYADKLFLYGPSGCGKSRAIFELIKEELGNFRKIYFINPRNTVVSESGRIKLLDLIGKLKEGDAVVWDNFPDDLIKRGLDNARNVLEIVSSKSVKRFIVALKPKYLEIYRDLHNRIPEFHMCEVAFDKEQIKSIIKSYGTDIAQFRELYKKYVERDIDKISRILWQKEPTPLTILDYYKELTNKIKKVQETGIPQNDLSIDAISEAERLLRSTHYYEHQFSLISNTPERQADAEFLYTVKLCYESGLNNTFTYVEHLQKKIFDSIPPRELLRKLSTWIYLSGQYYAMHDISREAIKFNHYARIKIMNYLTNNFIQVVPKSDSQVYSLGIFFGKNIEYIPRDDPHAFLPDIIYNYMKSKRYFEIGIGQGSGESILSLNEELKREILRRAEIDIEFGRGLADSLGRSFPFLDQSSQQQILDMINSGDPFARYFGGSLGGVLDHLSKESQNRIFELIKKDGAFADGIGTGLGYAFTSLVKDFQAEILKKAEKNSEFTRGLGMGFGRAFPFLDKRFQDELLTKCEINHEFAMGLGMGFGINFPYLQQDLRTVVLNKADNDNEFAYGLGVYVAFFFASLPLDLQTAILEKAEKNFLFARGLGLGFGYTFVYLPEEFQKELFTKASKNVNLADGIGQGLGFVFKHLPPQFKKQLYHLCNTNIGLSYGLGFGIGFCFKYVGQPLREEVFQRAEQDGAFAYGLGRGLGKTFRFRPVELQNELLLKIEKNQEFARGLGDGLGFTFVYQSNELQSLAFLKAQSNHKFAQGLGMGFGRMFRYLPKDLKELLYEKMQHDPQLAAGLGIYLGQVFTYQTNEIQKRLLELANNNSEFAEGLGYGFGYVFSLHAEQTQNDILEKSKKNSRLMYGLGVGIGNSFSYLSMDLQKDLLQRAKKSTYFAEGLGEGLGYGFTHLPHETQEQFFYNESERNAALIRGLAIGFGCEFTYLPSELQNQVLAKAEQDQYFGAGLGLGLGWTWKYLSELVQKGIQNRLQNNRSFARGLGMGIGQIFRYLQSNGSELRPLHGMSDNNEAFTNGLGFGVGTIFHYLDMDKQREFIKRAEVDAHFATGLGQGLGKTFPYFAHELQSIIVEQAIRNPNLLRSLAFGIGYIYDFLEERLKREVIVLSQELNRKFAEGLGESVGYIFPLLSSELQEEFLVLATTNPKFANGLGMGLGYAYSHLDNTTRNSLLEWAGNNSDFACGLGTGLGKTFVSLSEPLQDEVISAIEMENCKILPTFRESVLPQLRYCAEELSSRIQKAIGITISKDIMESRGADISVTDASYGDNPKYNNDYFLLHNTVEAEEMLPGYPWKANKEQEVSFSGLRQNYCVYYIDMMDSTKITSQLKDNDLSKYYALFLNATATIGKNFGARIIKNAGDCLILYFPKTSDGASNNNASSLKDVLECGITMMAAHRAINAKLHEEKLPPLNYRISADFGRVEVARSKSSQSDDLFGSAMNMCAKINSKAPANGMVIGEEMYKLVGSFKEYDFEKIQNPPGDKYGYNAYIVQSKQKRIILNPFKRV